MASRPIRRERDICGISCEWAGLTAKGKFVGLAGLQGRGYCEDCVGIYVIELCFTCVDTSCPS